MAASIFLATGFLSDLKHGFIFSLTGPLSLTAGCNPFGFAAYIIPNGRI